MGKTKKGGLILLCYRFQPKLKDNITVAIISIFMSTVTSQAHWWFIIVLLCRMILCDPFCCAIHAKLENCKQSAKFETAIHSELYSKNPNMELGFFLLNDQKHKISTVSWTFRSSFNLKVHFSFLTTSAQSFSVSHHPAPFSTKKNFLHSVCSHTSFIF